MPINSWVQVTNPNPLVANLFDFEYPKSKGDAFENEIDKLIAFLKTRDSDDIKMCYQMLKIIFGQIEKNYRHTGKPANIS